MDKKDIVSKSKPLKIDNKDRKILRRIDKSSKWEDVKEVDMINDEIKPLGIYKDFIGLGCSKHLNDSASSGLLNVDEMFRNCREAEKVRVRYKKKEVREARAGKGLSKGNIGALTSQPEASTTTPSIRDVDSSQFKDEKNMDIASAEKLKKAFVETLRKNNNDLEGSLSDMVANFSGLMCLDGGFSGLSLILNGISKSYDKFTGIGYQNAKWVMSPDIYKGVVTIAKTCGIFGVINAFLKFKGWISTNTQTPPRIGGVPPPSDPNANQGRRGGDDDDDDDGDDPQDRGGGRIPRKEQQDLTMKPGQVPQPVPGGSTEAVLPYLLKQQSTQQNDALRNANIKRLFEKNVSNPIKKTEEVKEGEKVGEKPKEDANKERQKQEAEPLAPNYAGMAIIGGVGSAILGGINYMADSLSAQQFPGNQFRHMGDIAGQGNIDDMLGRAGPATGEPVSGEIDRRTMKQKIAKSKEQKAQTEEARKELKKINDEIKRQKEQERQQERDVNKFIDGMDVRGSAWGLVNPGAGAKLVSSLPALGMGLGAAFKDTLADLQKSREEEQGAQKTLLDDVETAAEQSRITAMKQARANDILVAENEKMKRQMDLVKAQEEGTGGLGYQLSPEEEALVKEQEDELIQQALEQQRVEEEKLEEQEKAQLAKQQALEIEELTQVLSDEEEGKKDAEHADRLLGEVSPPPEFRAYTSPRVMDSRWRQPPITSYMVDDPPVADPLSVQPAVPVSNAPPLTLGAGQEPVNAPAIALGLGTGDAEVVIQEGQGLAGPLVPHPGEFINDKAYIYSTIQLPFPETRNRQYILFSYFEGGNLHYFPEEAQADIKEYIEGIKERKPKGKATLSNDQIEEVINIVRISKAKKISADVPEEEKSFEVVRKKKKK
jgi:hypothetical protein